MHHTLVLLHLNATDKLIICQIVNKMIKSLFTKEMLTQLGLQVGTNHPLLKSAKNLLLGSKSNLQSVGLIVLLVSKAAGFNVTDYSRDHHDSGVLHAQRALAEIVEMKRTGHLIHKTMVNLREKQKYGDKYNDLLYGNKIVLLTGMFWLVLISLKFASRRW